MHVQGCASAHLQRHQLPAGCLVARCSTPDAKRKAVGIMGSGDGEAVPLRNWHLLNPLHRLLPGRTLSPERSSLRCCSVRQRTSQFYAHSCHQHPCSVVCGRAVR